MPDAPPAALGPSDGFTKDSLGCGLRGCCPLPPACTFTPGATSGRCLPCLLEQAPTSSGSAPCGKHLLAEATNWRLGVLRIPGPWPQLCSCLASNKRSCGCPPTEPCAGPWPRPHMAGHRPHPDLICLLPANSLSLTSLPPGLTPVPTADQLMERSSFLHPVHTPLCSAEVHTGKRSAPPLRGPWSQAQNMV